MRDMSPAAVHKRLVFPQNSVLDIPIDMKRLRSPPPPPPVLIVPVLKRRPPTIAAPIPAPVTPYIIPRQYPSPEDITRVVCEHFRVMPVDLISDRRDRPSARARQVWAYLARSMTPHSLPVIGRLLGNRDHTTILSGYHKVIELSVTDPVFGAKVAAARQAVVALFSERQNISCFDTREI